MKILGVGGENHQVKSLVIGTLSKVTIAGVVISCSIGGAQAGGVSRYWVLVVKTSSSVSALAAAPSPNCFKTVVKNQLILKSGQINIET